MKLYFPGAPRLAAILLCAAVAGIAQLAPAPASPGGASAIERRPKFEVISIRRHTAQAGPVQIGPTPDGFRSIGVPMFAIFQLAYVLPNQRGVLRGNQIEGDPGWLTGELYDVDARVDQTDLADWRKPAPRQAMLRAMLQDMLAERCKVALHYASKEAPVYNLLTAKGGPKFRPAETVDPSELRRMHPAGGVMRGTGVMAVEGPNRIQFYAISMAVLTNTILSSLADRPVADKTGLSGYYDLALPSSALRRPPPPPSLDASSPPIAIPPVEDQSIFAALEALGLRLQPARGQVVTLVIDHVERPSGN